MASAALSFPCDFTLKVIGLDNVDFQAEVLSILREHFPQLSEGALSQKHSKNKKYLAFTITVRAVSQSQLDALYQALSDSPHILFAL